MPTKKECREKELAKTIKRICKRHPSKVLRALLDTPFWPEDIARDTPYRRYEDDSKLGSINVSFTPDGDAWLIPVPDPNDTHFSTRFRTYNGGGESARTRVALTFLAVAIDLDNKARPQNR